MSRREEGAKEGAGDGESETVVYSTAQSNICCSRRRWRASCVHGVVVVVPGPAFAATSLGSCSWRPNIASSSSARMGQ